MIIKVCKFVLLSRPLVFAFFYPCVVAVLTIIVFLLEAPLIEIPGLEHLVDIFAEYVWYYIAAFLSAFLVLTHWTLAGGKVKLLPVARVVLSFCISHLICLGLDVLYNFLGHCSNADFKTNSECVGHGFTWTPVPRVPVTCFLTFYGMLVILEEAAVFGAWDEVEDMIRHRSEYNQPYVNDEPDICDNPRGFKDIETLVNMHIKFTTVVKLLFYCLAILVVLMHIDNLLAIIYYQYALLKIAATLMPLPIWLVTYRILFRIDTCGFNVQVNRARIEEYFTFTEQTMEKYNLIEEIEYRNDVKPSKSFLIKLLSRFYRDSYTYDDL